jgi:hypothetical protein
VSEERKKILGMIAEGKITPEDGERLLAAMGEPAASSPPPPDGGHVPAQRSSTHRWLRIHVDTSEGERVRVNVPWKLAKFALNFIPKEARARLGDEGFDVSEVIDGIASGAADGEILSVDTNKGDKIRIVVE